MHTFTTDNNSAGICSSQTNQVYSLLCTWRLNWYSLHEFSQKTGNRDHFRNSARGNRRCTPKTLTHCINTNHQHDILKETRILNKLYANHSRESATRRWPAPTIPPTIPAVPSMLNPQPTSHEAGAVQILRSEERLESATKKLLCCKINNFFFWYCLDMSHNVQLF